MARTLIEIYDAIDLERQNNAMLQTLQPNIDTVQALLNDITTPSRVAEWRLMQWIVAVAIWSHEKLWDLFKAEVEDIAANAVYGTPRWFHAECFKFQYGDQLQWIGNKFQYSDTTSLTAIAKQIIKRAAIVETGGQVRIKVAKISGGVVTPLSSLENGAFGAYIRDIRPAGTNTLVISIPADSIRFRNGATKGIRAFYDPEVLSPAGELLDTPGVFPLADAITDYIGNLPFNGRLALTFLTDAMQQARGIINVELLIAEAWYGINTPAQINTEYIPEAGYLEVDPLSPLDAATSIDYQAYV